MRFWELTTQRGWARIILGRCLGPEVAPAEPGTTARDPGEAPNNYFKHFTPGHGCDTVNGPGFDWRGSAGA